MTSFLTILLSVLLQTEATARSFKSTSGQTIEAEILSVSGDMVTLTRSDGKTFNVPADRFSLDDQQYIKKWQEENKGKVPAHLKDKLPRMTMRISTGKTSKDDDQIAGYIDERKQKVQLSATMENNDAIYPISGAKLTMMVFGESPETGDKAVVYWQEFKDIELPLNEVRSWEGKGFELWYDDRGAMYGYKYEGYLAFLEDPEGKILHATSIPGTAAKSIEEARKLRAGDVYDRSYKKGKKVSLDRAVKNMR
ncbi:MAG: SHD1 domain-containing protein [Verrucomicrobiota bacterium]